MYGAISYNYQGRLSRGKEAKERDGKRRWAPIFSSHLGLNALGCVYANGEPSLPRTT